MKRSFMPLSELLSGAAVGSERPAEERHLGQKPATKFPSARLSVLAGALDARIEPRKKAAR